MKVPVLLLILLLISVQIGIAGALLFKQTPERSSCCGTSCTMQTSGQSSAKCSCSTMPTSALPQNTCSCTHQRMMIPVPGISDRVRQYMVRGYRRISRKNVLENESRKILYSLIINNPGLEQKSLVKLSGLNEHTLKYHLDQIVAAGHITICQAGNNNHYFENHGAYSDTTKHLMSRFHHKGPGKILSAVQDHPGLSRGELASLLGVSGPVVSRIMQRLIKEGLIRQEVDGKFRRYYPEWDPTSFSHSMNS
jgi:Uncharacterized protein conserved in archaea